MSDTIPDRSDRNCREAPGDTAGHTPNNQRTVAPRRAAVRCDRAQLLDGDAVDVADRYVVDCAGLTLDDGALSPDGELARRMRATYDAARLRPRDQHRPHRSIGHARRRQARADDEMDYDGGANPRRRIDPERVRGRRAARRRGCTTTTRWPTSAGALAAIGFLGLHAAAGGSGPDVRVRQHRGDRRAARHAVRPEARGVSASATTATSPIAARSPAGSSTASTTTGSARSTPRIRPSRSSGPRPRASRPSGGPTGCCGPATDSPAFEYFPRLDRNVLYASVADHGMWFDTWPLVAAPALRGPATRSHLR